MLVTKIQYMKGQVTNIQSTAIMGTSTSKHEKEQYEDGEGCIISTFKLERKGYTIN